MKDLLCCLSFHKGLFIPHKPPPDLPGEGKQVPQMPLFGNKGAGNSLSPVLFHFQVSLAVPASFWENFLTWDNFSHSLEHLRSSLISFGSWLGCAGWAGKLHQFIRINHNLGKVWGGRDLKITLFQPPARAGTLYRSDFSKPLALHTSRNVSGSFNSRFLE